MPNKLRFLICKIRRTSLWVVATAFCLMLSVQTTYAWEVETVMGIKISGGSGQQPLTQLVGQVLNILYGFAGASALVMIVFGAYRYISASGDPKPLAKC